MPPASIRLAKTSAYLFTTHCSGVTLALKLHWMWASPTHAILLSSNVGKSTPQSGDSAMICTRDPKRLRSAAAHSTRVLSPTVTLETPCPAPIERNTDPLPGPAANRCPNLQLSRGIR